MPKAGVGDFQAIQAYEKFTPPRNEQSLRPLLNKTNDRNERITRTYLEGNAKFRFQPETSYSDYSVIIIYAGHQSLKTAVYLQQ